MRLASKSLAACTFVLLACATTRADWLEASTENFVIYSDGSEASLREFATNVEQFHQTLVIVTGIKPHHFGPKLRVFVMRNGRAVRELVQSGRYTEGFYRPNLHGSIAVINRSKPDGAFDITADALLFQVYGYHFLQQHSPVAYPAWYLQGFGEYVSSAEFTPSKKIIIGKAPPNRVPSLFRDRWFKGEQFFVPPSDITEYRKLALSAQSWLLTHYLFHDPQRSKQFGAYLAAINEGKPHAESFSSTFNLPLDKIDDELRRYRDRLRNRRISLPTIDRAQLVTPAVTTRKLGAAEADGIELAVVIRPESTPENRAELAARAMEYLAKHEQNPGANLLAAEALFAACDFGRASELATRALNEEKTKQRAQVIVAAADLYRLAEQKQLTPETVKPIRTRLASANRLNPDDPMALYYFFQSYVFAGQKPTANAADGLATVLALVPQDTNVRLALGQYLAKTEQHARARVVLEPLAYGARESGPAEAARNMLAKLPPAAPKDPSQASAGADANAAGLSAQ
jgi:hypothetical protein